MTKSQVQPLTGVNHDQVTGEFCKSCKVRLAARDTGFAKKYARTGKTFGPSDSPRRDSREMSDSSGPKECVVLHTPDVTQAKEINDEGQREARAMASRTSSANAASDIGAGAAAPPGDSIS